MTFNTHLARMEQHMADAARVGRRVSAGREAATMGLPVALATLEDFRAIFGSENREASDYKRLIRPQHRLWKPTNTL